MLSEDINIITAEINSYKQVAGQAIFEIGRRLKHVKENDLVHGEWGNWLESIKMDRSEAYRFIKVVEELGGENVETFQHLGLAALNQIATLPEEQREKPHMIPSTGETKQVDEMTVRELREVKKKLKEEAEMRMLAESENESLIKQLQAERDKPIQTKVETKTVEKVVDHTDYQTLNKLKEHSKNLQEELELTKRKLDVKSREANLYKEDSGSYKKLQEDMQKLTKEKSDLSRQIESATSISSLVVEIENTLQTKLAPIKYSRAVSEQLDNPVVINNIIEIVGRVKDWCNEMESLTGSNRSQGRVYVDGEIIEAELV